MIGFGPAQPVAIEKLIEQRTETKEVPVPNGELKLARTETVEVRRIYFQPHERMQLDLLGLALDWFGPPCGVPVGDDVGIERHRDRRPLVLQKGLVLQERSKRLVRPRANGNRHAMAPLWAQHRPPPSMWPSP